MADAYSQTVSGEVATTLGANARKVSEVYNTGTRQLVFLQLDVTCVTGNLATNYASADSNFSKLMSILQQRIEIYGVGEPNDQGEITIITTKDSLAMTAAEEADPGDDVDVIKNTIEAESAIFSNATIYWGSKITGWSIENDC
jgi:hypothetical protein